MRILVTRLSALGDVAMLVPVIKAFTEQHPEHEVMVVSRGFLKPLFAPLPVLFFTADVYGKHKGLPGIFKLYKELNKSFKPDLVLDMHHVLRTRLLANFFKLGRAPVFKIDKGRAEKKALTAKHNKVFKPLKHTAQRYADVFKAAGLSLDFDEKNPPLVAFNSAEANNFFEQAIENPAKAIGIAPFAAHKGKQWPKEKMKTTFEALAKADYEILLFGGPADADELSVWAYELPNTLNVAGRFELNTELAIISKLKVMLAMDSSNMHFAALVGTPVVSVWGATHPHAGFTPMGTDASLQVQVPQNELSCRPCSVYGNKECWRGDYACLLSIDTSDVTEKITSI